MKDLWKFIKSSGIYFVGTVLTKLISFLLLPLYTAYISPADYGVYDLYNAYISFLCSVLFLDIWAGIMRFMYDYTGEEKKKPISCGLSIFSISSMLYTVILIGVFAVFHIEYPLLLFAYGILMNLQTLVGYIARGYGKNVLYTAAGLIGSIVTIVFNIILLVNFKMDYSALFIASCIGYIVNIAIVVFGVKVPHVFSLKNFDKQLFREMLRFSLPLCLNSVAYWFLTSYNRVAISAVLGTEANGYYAIAGRFGSMITLFTTCFQMAWQELAFSKSAKDNNNDNFYSVAINSYIKSMGCGLVLMIPVIYIIYPFMINDSYNGGKELIPLYLMGTILSTISSFLGNTFSAIKKNNLLFVTMLVGSVANVASVHLLLPVIGIQASNVALMLGFALITITRIVLLKKEMKLDIEYSSVILLLITFMLVSVCYLNFGILYNFIALLIAGVLTLYLFRDIIKELLQRLKNIKKVG